MTLPDRLAHLPDRKRRELERAAQILFDEFDDALKTKLSDKAKRGRILKLILFGSYARGDWVEDRKSGYLSDYDLLVIVNEERFAEQYESWEKAAERFLQELTITRQLATPVNFIVHTYQDVNSQLAQGRPFFVDIARDGIVIYEAPGYPLASPKPLAPEEARAEAQRHFKHWFPLGRHALKLAQDSIADEVPRDAAFLLHQAAERLYHCVLLVLALYSPKSHRLTVLRSQAERIAPQLIDVWPRDSRFAKRSFTILDRAYVGARYSDAYEISGEELAWLVERVKLLQETVAAICAERLEPEGAAGSWTYDNIVAAEIAIRILNQARAMISTRLHEIKDTNPALVKTLRAKRRELLALQQSIRADEPDAAKAIAAAWGPRVKDDARFWREL
ncbi:HEPN domain-containing protein [Pseudochelatococcus contaminans]|jgi:predicted nucleotidyltransferase/HEPN domain-containing protein|uniref:Putative nucleotidyltransferase/HEPN domain-containing protein n=1 Tax=Pseudochelatococcus contaminans TaxID=1538103 RepID=A0A7W6EIW5_9HYPH|nr:putative nucleotidyltransferase/HEPN domain-containing protein [Pseudochelatococcus contaminans]